MRIGLVGTYPPSKRHLNEHTAYIAEALAQIPQVDVRVFADIVDQPELPTTNAKITVDRCWRVNNLMSLVRMVLKIIKSDCDVVWFNLVFPVFSDHPVTMFFSLSMPMILRLFGFKTVVTLHAPLEFVDLGSTRHRNFLQAKMVVGRVAQRMLLRAHIVFVFLDRYAEFLRRRYHRSNIHRSWHGIEDSESATANKTDAPAILVFGRFGGYKRLEFAIEAFKHLKAKRPAARMTIAGSSHPSYPDYYDMVKTENSQVSGLNFIGYTPEDKLEELFRDHAVVWLPYQSSTGVSGVAHRACRYGMPIVLPDLPDFSEMLKDEGICAEIYARDSVDAAVTALAKILDDQSLRDEMGEKNAAVAKRLPINKIVAGHVDFFKRSSEHQSPHWRDARLIVAAIAVVSVLLNALALKHGFFRTTYDAYIHIFFASHYQNDWLETWEGRWYGGFDLSSYPPLVHQLIALFGNASTLLTGYQAVQLACFPLLIFGMYRFAMIWEDTRAAVYASLALAFSTAISQAAYQWGQLPTIFSLAFLLHGLASFRSFQRTGQYASAAASISAFCVSLTAHHITIVFGLPFFLIAIGFLSIHEARKRNHGAKPEAKRAMVLLGLFAAIGAVFFSPFVWYVSHHSFTQVPIYHASRANFAENFQAMVLFFLIPWGCSIFFLPALLLETAADRRQIGLLAATLGLLAFGAGGTIPGVRLLLGDMFEVLTLDRFTLWGTIMALPLVGRVIARTADRQARFTLCTAILIVNGSYFLWLNQFHAQPGQIDVRPLARYLSTPTNSRYRYLTLGFGSQMSWLATNTTAQSVDGLYHTVRKDSVLRSSGIEAIDSAKYFGEQGDNVLNHYLQNPAQYHLKFVASLDHNYDPKLAEFGWQRTSLKLAPDLTLWKREDVPPLSGQEIQQKSDLPLALRVLRAGYPLLILAWVGSEILRMFPIKRRTNAETTDANVTTKIEDSAASPPPEQQAA